MSESELDAQRTAIVAMAMDMPIGEFTLREFVYLHYLASVGSKVSEDDAEKLIALHSKIADLKIKAGDFEEVPIRSADVTHT